MKCYRTEQNRTKNKSVFPVITNKTKQKPLYVACRIADMQFLAVILKSYVRGSIRIYQKCKTVNRLGSHWTVPVRAHSGNWTMAKPPPTIHRWSTVQTVDPWCLGVLIDVIVFHLSIADKRQHKVSG